MNWTEICKGCGECCGPVPFMPAEFIRFEHLALVPYEVIPFVGDSIIPAATEDLYCVFLDRLIKRCVIYESRPEVCRLQGTIPNLPCPVLQDSPKLLETK